MGKKVEVELIFDPEGKGVKAVRTADGEILNLEKGVDKTEKSTKKLSTAMKVGLAGALIGVATAAKKGFNVLNESIELAGIQQIAERKLEQALANLGDTSEASADQLKQIASETQAFSNFGDEAIITAQAMLLSFGSVAGPEGAGLLTPRLADLAAGVANATGQTIDLNAAAAALGKALGGGAGALREYGISLTAVQEESFNTLEGLDKVNLLTEILDSNFKGLAASTADAGVQMGNAIGDLKESLGSELLPEIESLQREVTAFVQDPQIINFAKATGEAILNFGRGTIRFFQFSIPIAFNRFKASFAEVSSNVVSGVGSLVGILADPFGAITGGDVANPFQATIDSLNGTAEAARAAEDALINLELQQSANAIVAAIAAEQNRNNTTTLTENTVATRESTQATKDKEEAELDFDAIFAQVTNDLTAMNDERTSSDLAVLGKKSRQMLEDYTNAHTDSAETRIENEKALAKAIEEGLAVQIGAVDTSIKTGADAANSVAGNVRRVIQAKIGEAIAKMLASVPFPANLLLGAVFGASINALFNRLIPAFADGVTGFEGGVALVGERGPELVNLPGGSNVITNENTQQILGRLDSFAAQGSAPDTATTDQTAVLTEAISTLR